MWNVQFNIGPSRDAIRRAQDLLENPQPMFQEIGEDQLNEHRQRFVRGVGPSGAAWAPKSPVTIERYRARGYGNLTKPLIGASKRLGREILEFVSRDGVIIGSNLAYAGTMQDGAAKGQFGRDRHGRPIPWGRIPAREWLGISKEGALRIVAIADEHAERALAPK